MKQFSKPQVTIDLEEYQDLKKIVQAMEDKPSTIAFTSEMLIALARGLKREYGMLMNGSLSDTEILNQVMERLIRSDPAFAFLKNVS